MWHLTGILVCGTYMALTCFLSNDVGGTTNDTTAFVMLRLLIRGIILLSVPMLVLVLASVSCVTDYAMGIM